MSWGKKETLMLAAVLLATALAYANSLRNPFTTDDRHIILKNFQPWQNWTLGDLFTRSLFSTSPSESSYFRPLTLLTFALNYPLAGPNPSGYRAVNIGIHLLVVALIALLAAQLVGRWVAIFSALLYALHPVHVQAVSYISSRSDLLYTALALLCLLLWIKGSHSQGTRKNLYCSSALCVFFLGLFAKENIVVIPAIVLAMDFIWDGGASWRSKMKSNIGWYVGFAALFSVYFLIRLGAGFPLSMEGGREFALGLRIPFALRIFTLYVGLILYPAHLSLFRVVPVPEGFFEWQVIFGALLLIGMLAAAWYLRQSHKEISFGLLWYLVSAAPIVNLTLLNAPMMEHWLYFPLIGLTLALVSAVRTIAEKVGEVRGAALGFIFLALLLSARTISRNAEWGDLTRLFSRDVSHYPGNWRAWSWLGDALKTEGRLNEAIRAYRNSLSLNPKQAPTWVALAEALSVAGHDDEAERIFAAAVVARPREPWFWYLLGIHRLKVGQYQKAIEPLEKSIELQSSPMAYHALASTYLRLGQKEKAEEAFHKAILMYPGQSKFHSGVHIDLGKLYLRQGKPKEAREEWQIALRFEPNNAKTRELLAKQAK
ncbi:MAG: tetratricopeptide repeat protein [Deltaproteobacteria bacterium]|nr:tetratricopeptide repeat protein [Deltaproteobacteria bacterium]